MEFRGSGDLLREEVSDDLDAELSPVDVVAEEEEVGGHELGPHPPEDLLEAYQVLEVAVQVTCKRRKEVRGRFNSRRSDTIPRSDTVFPGMTDDY